MEYFILIKWINIKIFNILVIFRLIKKSYMFWEKLVCLKIRSYFFNYFWDFFNLYFLRGFIGSGYVLIKWIFLRKRFLYRDIRNNWNYIVKIFERYFYYVEDYRYECVKCRWELSISKFRLLVILVFLFFYNFLIYGGFKELFFMLIMGSYL